MYHIFGTARICVLFLYVCTCICVHECVCTCVHVVVCAYVYGGQRLRHITVYDDSEAKKLELS